MQVHAFISQAAAGETEDHEFLQRSNQILDWITWELEWLLVFKIW